MIQVVSPIVECPDQHEASGTAQHSILLVAYCCQPLGTMEERNGWCRAIQAAQNFRVTVLYHPTCSYESLLAAVPDTVPAGNLRLVPIENQGWANRFEKMECMFYMSYRAWHRKAFEVAKQLHEQLPFDLAHLVSLCGYREPGYVWQLPIPHVWGPIGGTHNFPAEFHGLLDPWNALRESMRSLINYYQLNFCRRIRTAARASTVLAASQSAQRELVRIMDKSVEVDLETGIEYPISAPRSERSVKQPLRVLWAGRFREWKALPLLLYAMKELPQDVQMTLRIVGHGQSQKRWTAIANRLKLQHPIEWIARPKVYRDSLEHYEWADAFAFTSLRDTSGTGLLESLAAGTPIIGVDHQGAADIMTDDCAVRVPVTTRQGTIQGFAQAITKLYRDPNLWLTLSHGATQRAEAFTWKCRHAAMFSVYERLLAGRDALCLTNKNEERQHASKPTV